MEDLEKFKQTATGRAKENKKFLSGLSRLRDDALDNAFHETHEEVFAEMDCLTCANCCKTTSPIFYPTDIERVSRALRMKPGDFIDKFLRVDEDNDYVLKSSPCPFLGPDNYCGVYESRPKACREYPHTDRKKMSQVLDLTYRNTLVCPAVLSIVEKIKSRL
jgi:Fe-S-cluster containining protein